MDSRFGILVAVARAMGNVCRHCDEPIVGTVYRVTSEADGVPLLNMVVCASCADVAKNLLLHTEEITLKHMTPAAPLSDVADRLLAYPENGGYVISSSQ